MDDKPGKANGVKRPRFQQANGFKRPMPTPPPDSADEDVNVSIVNVYGSGPFPIRRRPDAKDDTE